jgi:hypothetical protein
MSGNSGTSVPSVSSEPSYTGYTQPANWSSPAVSGQNLMVHTGTLRSVASQLGQMADKLQSALSGWQSAAQAASAGAGSWPTAQALAHVMGNAYTGVQQFTSQLQQAHSDMAKRLGMSADRYDSNEQDLTLLANRSTAAGSMIVGAGGNNTPVVPTPAQARVLDLEHHTEGPGDNENWQATFPITENAAFVQGSTAGYSWQQVKSLLEATDPAAITSAGAAYQTLSGALTDVSGQLAGQGGQLSGDWGGSTAVTAVSQMQQLWQTASDLQANTFSAAATLSWYGPVLQSFKDNPPTMTPAQGKNGKPPAQSAVTAASNAADQAAQQHLAALNGHMQTAFYNMPPVVNKNLPPGLTSNGGSNPAPATTGGGGGGLTGGGMPSGTGGGSGVPGVASPHVGQLPGGTTPPGGTSVGSMPPGSTPPGDHLSGGTSPVTTTGPLPVGSSGPGPVSTMPPPGSGTGPGPIGMPPPPGPGGTGPGSTGSGGEPVPGGGETTPGGSGDPVPGAGETMPGLPGGVMPGGPGGGLAGEPGPGGLGGVGTVGDPDPDLVGLGTPGIGPDGVITGPGGALGASGDELAASGGALGGEAGGQGMMPMMGMPGGASGQGGLGRARDSWTSEDEGTWGPDAAAGGAADGADATADGMFPGMMPLGGTGGGQGQDKDRFRQAWMAEDEDVWGAGQPAVPPVISLN